MPSTRIMQKAAFFGADFTVAAAQFYDMIFDVSFPTP